MPQKTPTTITQADIDADIAAHNAQPDIDLDNFKEEIAAHESKGMGDYQAENDSGGGEGAIGKYQFRWSKYKDDIKKQTGIDDSDDFKDDHEAQDKYMDHYVQNNIIPWVHEQKESGNTRGLTDKQLGIIKDSK